MGEAGQVRRGGGSKATRLTHVGLAEAPVQGGGEICYGAQVSHRVIYLVGILVNFVIVASFVASCFT